MRVIVRTLVCASALAALALWPAAARRARAADECPLITVSCPPVIDVSGPVTFAVQIEGLGATWNGTLSWTVSTGGITSGQGGPVIVVEGVGADSVEATVEVGGLLSSCPKTASCTTKVFRCGRALDTYGNIQEEDEKARLDNFAIELQNNPAAQGYIIAYGGRRGRAGEAQRRADRARDYIAGTRGISASRIVTVNGGFREDLTVELFIVPAGMSPPVASPTVDPAEVEVISDGPRRQRRPGKKGRRAKNF